MRSWFRYELCMGLINELWTGNEFDQVGLCKCIGMTRRCEAITSIDLGVLDT